MASVSSLDKDLRSMRLDKYTPQRENETRQWIEGILGESLKPGDLLEALKDGISLCKLVNLATGPNSVRYKASSMPFVQMENISHFLRACQAPPLGLLPHDVFLTVDLFEAKDPAQVLQCIEAFSRRASAVQPTRFPKAIGGRKATAMTPQSTGKGSNQSPSRQRGFSNTSENATTLSGRTSPFKNGATSPSGGSSSWANKADVGATAPAWNIAQYGWTGGASQGNQGVMFGGRRQITTPAPHVPSLAEKQRKRREEEAEAERIRIQEEEAANQRRMDQEAEEERQRVEEARRWEEETRKLKEKQKREAEEEQRRWKEEERKWKEEEEIRTREEKEAEARLEKDRHKRGTSNDSRLQGQFRSQYQAEEQQSSAGSDRVKELERQLEEAKERERQYERERQERLRLDNQQPPPVLPNRPPEPPRRVPSQLMPEPAQETATEQAAVEEDGSWHGSERDYLRQAWSQNQTPTSRSPRPLPVPNPQETPSPPAALTPTSSRPLPDPKTYKPPSLTPSRIDSHLTSNPFPNLSSINSHTPPEAAHSSTSEREFEDTRRQASQNTTKAGGWASKSLLEREMELERQRQQEWEEGQRQTREVAERGAVDPTAGPGPGQSWDVNSYGFTGGDNLNKGGGGVYAGRRQILGPRPLGKRGG